MGGRYEAPLCNLKTFCKFVSSAARVLPKHPIASQDRSAPCVLSRWHPPSPCGRGLERHRAGTLADSCNLYRPLSDQETFVSEPARHGSGAPRRSKDLRGDDIRPMEGIVRAAGYADCNKGCQR